MQFNELNISSGTLNNLKWVTLVENNYHGIAWYLIIDI